MDVTLVTLLPTVALVVRRLRDTNRSGRWYLLSLPSLAGSVTQTVMLGDPSAINPAGPTGAFVALLPALALSLVGLVGCVLLLVFLISGLDARGIRFDRRPATTR